LDARCASGVDPHSRFLPGATAGDIMTGTDNDIGRIKIRFREVAHFFNSLDPSPFLQRDLDPQAEEYIVSWAREEPPDVPLRVVVYLPEQEANFARQHDLAAALSNYFDQEAAMIQRDTKELFRIGRLYLAVGLPVLFVSFLASHIVRVMLGQGPVPSALAESLLLVGWVANWKPIETYLYDWLPLRRKHKLYQRLRDAEVEILVG
jgi:hypothetical protein